MKTANPIKLILDLSLSGSFTRRGNTWRRDCEEAVLVVDLQKSEFSDSYYVNLGVFVKGLSESRDPDWMRVHEVDCHIRLRVGWLCDENGRKVLKDALDLRGAMSSTERDAVLRNIIIGVAVPYLVTCSTRNGICEAMRNGRLKPALITWHLSTPGFCES